MRTRYEPMDTSALDCAAVFFAHTAVDRTLIHEGRIPGAEEILGRIIGALDGRRLLIKSRPLALNNPVLAALIEKHRATICDLNTYAILASRHDVHALTWSSSVGLEAIAFGLPSLIFAPKVQGWSYEGVESVRWGRSVRLWGPLPCSVLPIARANDLQAWRPNCLRDELGTFGLDATIWRAETNL